jgi:hypothetical protein
MPDALIVEFDGVGRRHYDDVNANLGIDMATGKGAWPDGLLLHFAGAKTRGWVVFELWESQDAQKRFLEERLVPALEAAGVKPPDRLEWVDTAVLHDLKR